MSDTTTGVQTAWQERLDEGEFVIQRCEGCGGHVFFPRALCPHCGSTALVFEPTEGLGTVHSTTTVRRAAEAGGDYNVSLIDLDEGVRMMSRVEGEPGEVAIGQRVRARIAQRNGHGLVVFDLVDGEARP